MSGVRAIFETLRSLDSATLAGAYLPVGIPLVNPSSILKIVNNSNVLVTISTDGINDNDILPAGSFVLYDISSDAQIRSSDGNLRFPANTQFYAKAAAGIGLIYITSIYQGGE